MDQNCVLHAQPETQTTVTSQRQLSCARQVNSSIAPARVALWPKLSGLSGRWMANRGLRKNSPTQRESQGSHGQIAAPQVDPGAWRGRCHSGDILLEH